MGATVADIADPYTLRSGVRGFRNFAGRRRCAWLLVVGSRGRCLRRPARVTVFDNSPAAVGQDRLVAEREGLALETVQGDMADLGRFADGAFGLIFHPCSNCFAHGDSGRGGARCFRVLRPGGVLLAGFSNPVACFFAERTDGMDLAVRYRIPFADERDLEAVHLQKLR